MKEKLIAEKNYFKNANNNINYSMLENNINYKKRKGSSPSCEQDLWRKEYKNQDEFDYDRYVYGENDA